MINLPFFGNKNQGQQNQQQYQDVKTIEQLTAEQLYEKTKASLRDLITPVGLEVKPSFLKFSDKIVKTLFVLGYPKFLTVGWLSPVVNMNESVNVSIFFHPMDTEKVLKSLRKRVTQLEAQALDEESKGLIRNPMLQTAISDIEGLRDSLVQGRDKMFYISVYMTIVANSEADLAKIESSLVGLFGQKMIDIKPAVFRQFDAYESNMPLGQDSLDSRVPLNIGPASTFFPFISSSLIQSDGIFYGLNMQNSTPVIFDRFSLENSNCVIFAKSGSGKSYFTKLDIIRSLMKGIEVIVIDPENEYKHLTDAFDGSFFKISIQSQDNLNPFDLSTIAEDEDPITAFREKTLDLIGLIKVMTGDLRPEEEAILDQAIKQTYASRDITPETPFFGKEPPILEDLESVLRTMEGGPSLADKIYKYTKGTFAGFINQPTTVDMNNRLSVFSIRDLDEELRPVAMYIILGHIWNLIRREKKRRILVVDEAWWMMKNNEGASFLLSMAKRARKYFLGVTTITQDVDDFLKSPYGKPIITNSSIQFLMKQSAASIPSLTQAFGLTPQETDALTNISVGEGLLFAGNKHLILRVMASYGEDQVITTNPDQLAKIKKAKELNEENG